MVRKIVQTHFKVHVEIQIKVLAEGGGTARGRAGDRVTRGVTFENENSFASMIYNYLSRFAYLFSITKTRNLR